MSNLAVVVVTLAMAQPVFAQTQPPAAARARFGALRHAPPNPYGKLVDTASLVKTAHERENKDQPAQRSLVCPPQTCPGSARM